MILRTVLSFASRGRLSILIFHRVLAAPDPILAGEPSAAEFEALLAHIKSRFNVLPLADAVKRLYAGTLPAAALAITFDDGYADNLLIAAPILRKHGVPATVFIATGYLDGGVMWNDRIIAAFRTAAGPEFDLAPFGLGTHSLRSVTDRRTALDRVLGQLKYLPGADREQRSRQILRAADASIQEGLMLTADGVRSLSAFGIDVGAHTVTHPILAKTRSDEAWREICDGKRQLEDAARRPVSLFAYPNGRPGEDYLDDHVRMVGEAGFGAAVSTAWGAATPDSPRLQLPRFTPWTRKPMKFDLLMLRNLRHGFERTAATCG